MTSEQDDVQSIRGLYRQQDTRLEKAQFAVNLTVVFATIYILVTLDAVFERLFNKDLGEFVNGVQYQIHRWRTVFGQIRGGCRA